MKRGGQSLLVMFLALAAAAVLLALGTIWWWALLGMQPHVGTAASVSVVTLGMGALVAALVRWGP